MQKNQANQRSIDLRTDTSTLPTAEMLQAMMAARLGNDGLHEDPTVNELEALAASMLGKSAALFVPSGTMGNLVALLSYAERGEAFLAEEKMHVITIETGYRDVAQLEVQKVHSNLGVIDPEDLDSAAAKSPKRAKVLLLENTHNGWGGTVVPPAAMKAIWEWAQKRDLPVHLDGARIFNAATYLHEDVRNIARYADSVMFCLSKGLCAPVGSMVVGSEQFIGKCRTFRRVLGGGMRQAGVLAAAGLYALRNMIPRLSEDHKRAATLASGLSSFPEILIDLAHVQTNIVLFGLNSTSSLDGRSLAQKLSERGVKVGPRSDGLIRCVTHKDISEENIGYALEEVASITKAP